MGFLKLYKVMDILQIIKMTHFFKNVSTKDNVTVYKYRSLSKIAWTEIENIIRRRSKTRSLLIYM